MQLRVFEAFAVKPNALSVPPASSGDPNAFEIARIWVAHGAQHVTLKHDVWPDPAAWGILLADLARHVANAYGQSGRDPGDVCRRIREGFEAEMESPTDAPKGKIRE